MALLLSGASVGFALPAVPQAAPGRLAPDNLLLVQATPTERLDAAAALATDLGARLPLIAVELGLQKTLYDSQIAAVEASIARVTQELSNLAAEETALEAKRYLSLSPLKLSIEDPAYLGATALLRQRRQSLEVDLQRERQNKEQLEASSQATQSAMRIRDDMSALIAQVQGAVPGLRNAISDPNVDAQTRVLELETILAKVSAAIESLRATYPIQQQQQQQVQQQIQQQQQQQQQQLPSNIDQIWKPEEIWGGKAF